MSARISTVVMLSGGPRPSALASASGRPALDLPLCETGTLLDMWLERFEQLARTKNEPIEVRIVHDERTPAPTSPEKLIGLLRVSINKENGDFRGPAGLLRDTAEDVAADETVLLVEAARYPACDLAALAEAHLRHQDGGPTVTVAVNPDGSPAGVYAVDRSALDRVPEKGFLDLKEQFLSGMIAEGMGVWAQDVEAPGCFPIRDLAQLLLGARSRAEADNIMHDKALEGGDRGSLIELIGPRGGAAVRNRERFRLLQPGAVVAGSAAIVDAIVMDGAEVGEGAVVVRSLVCPGARVEPGQEVVDQVIR